MLAVPPWQPWEYYVQFKLIYHEDYDFIIHDAVVYDDSTNYIRTKGKEKSGN